MGTAWSAWRYRPAQALVIAGLSLLVTACAAFAPLYDRAMGQAVADQQLQQATTAQRTVTVTSWLTDQSVPLPPTDLPPKLSPDITRVLGSPVLGWGAHVSQDAPAGGGDGPLLWRKGECDHVTLVRGSCPTGGRAIAVTTADAAHFHLAPGSGVRVERDDGSEVWLRVVGVYAPVDTEWWQGTRLTGMSSAGGTSSSPAHDTWLTSEATFTGGGPGQFLGVNTRVGFPVDRSRIDLDDLLDTADRLQATDRALRGDDPPTYVNSGLVAMAKVVRTQITQGHKTVPLMMVQLGLLFVVVLWLVVTAATDQRRQEVALARLRGSGAAGARRLLLAELLPAMLAGVVPGAAVAVAGCLVVRRRLPGHAPFELTPLFWAALGVAVAALVLLAVSAAYRVAREPLETLLRRPSSRPTRWALGALDAVVVAAAGTAAVAFVTGSLTGPLALVGPALLALAVGLVLAHVASPAALLLGRRLLRRGRVAGGTGVLDAARSPGTRRTLTVVTVACALVVFAVGALSIGDRNWQALSEQRAGATAVLELDSTDLASVRAALQEVDPSGRRATPVAIAGETLAVDPDALRRIGLFPAGAPTAAQWARLAPPAAAPVEVTGDTLALTAAVSPDWKAVDLSGHPADVSLSVQVEDADGVRDIWIPALTARGASVRWSTPQLECREGCKIVGFAVHALPGATVAGVVSLSGVTVDNEPVTLASSTATWNTYRHDRDLFAVASAPGPGRLDLRVRDGGIYPLQITQAWVPASVPALVAGRAGGGAVTLHSLDGTDRGGTAVGTLPFVPAMPTKAQLVDLAALERGANLTPPTRLEVWLDRDDPGLVASLTKALEQRQVTVGSTRSLHDLRATYGGTVAAWSLELGAGIGVAGMLVALLVLLVLTVTGWRQRSRDLATLRMAGLPGRTLSALATWSQLPVVVVAAVAGITCGVIGVHVAMPTVPLFISAPDVDIVDLGTPWRLAMLTAAGCVVVLVAAAALTGRAVAHRARLERVKESI